MTGLLYQKNETPNWKKPFYHMFFAFLNLIIFIGNASEPFGHCCYNGCGNTCLQIKPKCKTETVTECKEIEIPPVEKCEQGCKDTCGATHNEICIMSNITAITQHCTEKCRVEIENVCEDKISQ